MASGGGERQHAPTPYRRQRARREGQIWRSADVPAAAGMLAGLAGVALWVPWAAEQWSNFWQQAAGLAVRAVSLGPLLTAGLATLARVVLPLAVGLMLWSLLLQAALQGFAIRFRWPARSWNPAAAWARLWSVATLWQALLAAAKLVALAGLAALGAWQLRTLVVAWVWIPPQAWLGTWWSAWSPILWRAAGGFALLAALDAFWQYRRWIGRLRMSTRELRDEQRELEGDPRLRQRRRAIGRQLLRRSLARIGEAAVVITNPTHAAVALEWKFGQETPPTVWIKGVDDTALAIRQAALEAGVPVVENPPLAWSLLKVPVGQAVPEEHWRAVATILAFLWRRRGQAPE